MDSSTRPSMLSSPPPIPSDSDVDRRRASCSHSRNIASFSSLLASKNAAAQQASSGFSFAVCGDSRPMMYLPVKERRTDLVGLFVEMFGLVMPGKVAEAVVKRDVTTIERVLARNHGGSLRHLAIARLPVPIETRPHVGGALESKPPPGACIATGPRILRVNG